MKFQGPKSVSSQLRTPVQLWHAKCLIIIGVRTRLVLFCLMSELTIKTQTSKYHTGTVARRERRCSVSSCLYVSTVMNGSWGLSQLPYGRAVSQRGPALAAVSRATPKKIGPFLKSAALFERRKNWPGVGFFVVQNGGPPHRSCGRKACHQRNRLP